MKSKSKIPPKTKTEEYKRVPFYTWTKHHGWRINGYLNESKNKA